MKVLILCLLALIIAPQSRSIEADVDDWNYVFHTTQYRRRPNDDSFLPSKSKHSNPRIVNGEEAKPHQFPYQIGIFAYTGNGNTVAFCGGSLISQRHILTAAHCVDRSFWWKVIIGTHNIDKPDSGSVIINTLNATIHPDWNSDNLVNDIAIIELPGGVVLNERIQLVKLPSKSLIDETFAGELSTVSGWGKTSDSSHSINPILRYSTNPVLTNGDCGIRMDGLNIPSSQVCQSGQGNRGACNGDIGGPLVVYRNEEPLQIGIVSYGHVCGCEKGYPVAYTRVTAFLDFITDNSDAIIEP